MNDELEKILEDTTSELGGTDQSYVGLLRFFQSNKTLLVPPRLLPGQLVFFTYKPISESFRKRGGHYDSYPLVVVTKSGRDGFEGVNLHFLSPKWREFLFAQMMENLATIPNKEREDWRTRFVLKENTLPSSARFKLYKPCFRRYLWEGVKRRPVIIPFDFWSDIVQAKLEGFKSTETGTRPKRIQRETVFARTYRRFIRGD